MEEYQNPKILSDIEFYEKIADLSHNKWLAQHTLRFETRFDRILPFIKKDNESITYIQEIKNTKEMEIKFLEAETGILFFGNINSTSRQWIQRHNWHMKKLNGKKKVIK